VPAPDDDLVLEYLRRFGAGCPNCGYDLGGAGSPVCPECGERLHLLLTNHPTRLAGHAAGLLGIAVSGFTFAVMALLILWPDEPDGTCAFLAAAAAHIWWAYRWHRGRPRYAGMSRPRRRAEVFLCWLPALIAMLVAAGLS
jgi:hypothetical protein